LHRLLSDALLAVVLEVVVGVGGDLGVGQAGDVATQGGRQAVVGIGVEDVFQAVNIAVLAVVEIGLRVVAVVVGGQDVAGSFPRQITPSPCLSATFLTFPLSCVRRPSPLLVSPRLGFCVLAGEEERLREPEKGKGVRNRFKVRKVLKQFLTPFLAPA